MIKTELSLSPKCCTRLCACVYVCVFVCASLHFHIGMHMCINSTASIKEADTNTSVCDWSI